MIKKTLLALAISSVLISPSYASVKVAAAVLSTEEGQQAVSLAKEVLADNWSEVGTLLSGAATTQEEMKDLPVKTKVPFKKDQSKAQAEINKLHSKIYDLLLDENIELYRARLEKIGAEKKVKNDEMAELQAQIGLSFDEDDILSLQQAIEEKEGELNILEGKRIEVITDVYTRLARYGINIDFNRVESLLARVDADDIIGLTTTFPILAEFTKYLGETAKTTASNSEASKRYYSLYVEVMAFQIYIQRQYENRLAYNYIPRLLKIRDEAEALVFETHRLKASAPEHLKASYDQNVKNQLLTLKVVDLYQKQLKSDLAKIKEARSLVQQSHTFAKNTLDTVNVSFNVSAMINGNLNMFDQVMALSMPELTIFEDSAMQAEYEKLTAQIKVEAGV